MRPHSNQEIIRKASEKEKNQDEIKNNRIDIAVDMDDNHGVTHTYVVTFERAADDWNAIDVNELSSL